MSVPPVDRAAIVAAYLSGEPIKSILTRFGVSNGTVWRYLRQAGVSVNRNKPYVHDRTFNAELNAVLAARRAAGEKIIDLATEHGVSPAAICRRIDRHRKKSVVSAR